jgi:integrase
LYRKRCGTYFLRVIVSAPASSSDGSGRQRKEVRYSLRTKDPSRARALAAWANARLELARDMNDRNDILNALGIRKMLTIEPNRITVENEQDVTNLLRIQAAHPKLLEAFAVLPDPQAEATRQMMLDVIHRRSAEHEARKDMGPGEDRPAVAIPPNPLRMSQAMEQYTAACNAAKLAEKTVVERERLLKGLVAHVVSAMPGVGADPFVHDIGTHHLSSFLDKVAKKATTDGTSTDEPASPLTLIKKVSGLRTFFDWAREEREATLADPTTGLGKRGKSLRKVAAKEKEHYEPFDTEQLKRMFEPSRYLAFNNHADYFWAPLLGLHLGTRLKEIITLELSDIDRHKPTGIWFMDVRPENAKNPNSIRRLPIPARLVELGFLEYIEQLRRLGATQLFPHRDLTSPTARLDPSKNCSRRFGEYLDTVGIVNPALVFHSFRHTVVTALQRAGTPLTDSMQIAGHQAQEHAIRIGEITAKQAQSVHIRTYTHADRAALNSEYPIERMQRHLDNAIQEPLDYARLRKAAVIVTEHMVKTMEGFKSGWSPLKHAHTDEQLERLK